MLTVFATRSSVGGSVVGAGKVTTVTLAALCRLLTTVCNSHWWTTGSSGTFEMDILDTTHSRRMGADHAFLPGPGDTLYDIAGSRGKEKAKDWGGSEHIWT